MADKLYFASKGIIVKDHKILVLYSYFNNKKSWDFPGGRMIIGEDPVTTLKREVFEETQMNIQPISLIDTWHYFRDKDFHVSGVFYYAKAISDHVVLSDEHDGYEWLSVDELKKQVHSHVYMSRINRWHFEKNETGFDIRVPHIGE